VLRLASPRFDVVIQYNASAALTAAQDAGTQVIVGEQIADGVDGVERVRPPQPRAASLLEAVRIRCPSVLRILLTAPEQLASLIPILHGGTANAIVSLPIDPKEFLAATGAHPLRTVPASSDSPVVLPV